MEAVMKECKKHGLVKHHPLRRNGEYERHRCSKCLSEAVMKRRRKMKTLAIEYKGGCCSRCGYNKSHSALEFHHIDPAEKDFALSVSGATRSWARVKAELDKCILVCANCHREVHDELRIE